MKTNKKQRRNNKGITLIALVITIIVLLILASVSIAMLTGDNGILTQAQRAKEATENAARNEAKDLQELESWMNGQITGEVQAYPVDDDNPGELDGEGTSEKPYKIESIEDLVAFSSIVNTGAYNGKSYSNRTYNGEYVELSQTLDFNYDGSYALESSLETGGLKDTLTNGGFEIIGKDFSSTNLTGNIFLGTFNGNGNTIKNVYIKNQFTTDRSGAGAGLFGATMGTIQNLNIIGKIQVNTQMTLQQSIGGVAALSTGTIENCNANITISGEKVGSGIKTIGGIVGTNLGNVNRCYANVNIEETGLSTNVIGGIVGANYNKVYNCVIQGNINAEKNGNYICRIGGIVGENRGICLNHVSDVIIEVENFDNSNTVDVGGIVGSGEADKNAMDVVEPANRLVGNCYFKGTIRDNSNVGTTFNIGGIIGRLYAGTMENCYYNGTLENIGTVKPSLYIGIGYAQDSTIKNCKYIDGENIINQSNCNLVDNEQEDLTDEKVLNYMNSYSSDEDLAKWTLSGGKFQFQ